MIYTLVTPSILGFNINECTRKNGYLSQVSTTVTVSRFMGIAAPIYLCNRMELERSRSVTSNIIAHSKPLQQKLEGHEIVLEWPRAL